MIKSASTKTVGYVLKKFPVLSETFILNEILALEAKGVNVHIFSLERPNDPRFHGDLPKLKARISYIPNSYDLNSFSKHSTKLAKYYGKNYRRALAYAVKHLKPSLFWRFLQSCYVANQAKQFNIGHFHAHFSTRPTTVVFFASMISGIPYSFSAHAMDIFKRHLNPKALVKKMNHARFVVTVSSYNLDYLSKIANGSAQKIVKIYNGINLRRFKPNGLAPFKPFIFICVARLVEKKGHALLIEACHRLRKRGIQFECWLVGKGKLRSEIQSQIKKHKLTDYVKLLGPKSQEEVVQCYHKAHAYVLPCIIGSDGNRDGLPVSIVEALACGLPVITTPMTGIPEVVGDRKNGLLVPPNDVDSLVEAFVSVIGDKDLYQQMRKNARPSVEKMFNMSNTVKDLKKLFEESMS